VARDIVVGKVAILKPEAEYLFFARLQSYLCERLELLFRARDSRPFFPYIELHYLFARHIAGVLDCYFNRYVSRIPDDSRRHPQVRVGKGGVTQTESERK
jgi:hypothetical protein